MYKHISSLNLYTYMQITTFCDINIQWRNHKTSWYFPTFYYVATSCDENCKPISELPVIEPQNFLLCWDQNFPLSFLEFTIFYIHFSYGSLCIVDPFFIINPSSIFNYTLYFSFTQFISDVKWGIGMVVRLALDLQQPFAIVRYRWKKNICRQMNQFYLHHLVY